MISRIPADYIDWAAAVNGIVVLNREFYTT